MHGWQTPGVIAQADATDLVQRAKLRLLEMHYQSKVGHIGGNLSALDILISLYHFSLGPDDEFVLSKGHSAGALYVTLWTMGLLSDEDLRLFHGEGTRLSGHPPLKEFQRSSSLPEAWVTVLVSRQAWHWARSCGRRRAEFFA